MSLVLKISKTKEVLYNIWDISIWNCSNNEVLHILVFFWIKGFYKHVDGLVYQPTVRGTILKTDHKFFFLNWSSLNHVLIPESRFLLINNEWPTFVLGLNVLIKMGFIMVTNRQLILIRLFLFVGLDKERQVVIIS